ncbi:MAG: hypothetical protein ACYCQJ_15520 [Nitrososphaerales archaeon]
MDLKEKVTNVKEHTVPEVRSTVSSVEKVWKDEKTTVTFTVDARG